MTEQLHRMTELIVAYNRALREARHLMALTRRQEMINGLIKQAADQFERAGNIAQKLEQEVADETGACREDGP